MRTQESDLVRRESSSEWDWYPENSRTPFLPYEYTKRTAYSSEESIHQNILCSEIELKVLRTGTQLFIRIQPQSFVIVAHSEYTF